MFNLEAPDWWVQVPSLSGPTLQLREVDTQDVDALFELLTDPQVSRYISQPPSSVAAFEGFIEWAHREREAGRCICFAVVPHGLEHAIGLIQFRALESTFHLAEWGFAMGAAFWSTGLFEEAAVLAAQFAFGTLGVHRLEARAVVQNSRGNGALQKLGAKGEAILRKAFNREHSQFLWAIVAEEWTAPQATPRTAFDAAQLKLKIESAVEQQPVQTKRSPRTWTRPFPFFLTDPFKGPMEES